MGSVQPIPYENIKVIDPKDPNLENSSDFHPLINSYFGGRFFYPLVFIPLTSKLYNSVADFNIKIMTKGNEIMRRAHEVYLIGYSASDQIIREMLRNAPPGIKLHVVGKESAETIMQELAKEFGGYFQRGNIYREGFTKFVAQM